MAAMALAVAPGGDRNEQKARRTEPKLVSTTGIKAAQHFAASRTGSVGFVGALFETRITAADQARLFLRIDRLAPKRHRTYARQLLSGIIGPQRWGIAPVAQARHFRVFFKSGWRKGIEHQVALLERAGRRIALAVLTSGEAAAYGRATEAGIASRVLAR